MKYRRSGRAKLIVGLLSILLALEMVSVLGPISQNPNLPAPIKQFVNSIPHEVQWASAQTQSQWFDNFCQNTSCSSEIVMLSSTIASGDTLVAVESCVSCGSNPMSTPTDTYSDTFTSRASDCGASNQCVEIWTAVTSASHPSDTVTFVQYPDVSFISVHDITGLGSPLTAYMNTGTSATAAASSSISLGAGDSFWAVDSFYNVLGPNNVWQQSGGANDGDNGFWSFTSGGAGTCSHICMVAGNARWLDWGGGSSTFSVECENTMSAGCSSTTWVWIGLSFSSPSVTLPAQCTMDNGASQATMTVSGGSASPTTLLCDGSSHNFTVNPSTSITFTEPSDGANTRDRVSGGGTSTSVSSCSSGTCSTFSFTNYEQIKETVQDSQIGGSTSANPSEQYMAAGALTSIALTTSGQTIWVDYGRIIGPDDYIKAASATNSEFCSTPECHNLAFYAPLDDGQGTAPLDLSHNNNTGVFVSTPTWAAGRFGDGLQFTGSGPEYVNFGNSATLRPSTFTIMSWANLSSSGSPGTWAGILTYSHDANWPAFGIWTHSNIVAGGVETAANTLSEANSGVNVANGKWQFVALIFTGSQVQLILNTTVEVTQSWSGTLQAGSGGQLQLGWDTSLGQWNGRLDEPRIYNTALNLAQVIQIEQATVPQIEKTYTTGGNTLTTTFYNELQNTFQVSAPQGTFNMGLSWVATGTFFGSSTNLGTITSTAAPSDSITVWEDYNQLVTIPQAASGAGANTRWQSSAACTFTQTTGGNTNNCNSYFQLSNTYQASTNGNGPPNWDSSLTAVVTGSLYGSTGQSICTISPSSGTTTTAGCTGYADYDASVAEQSTMSGAGSNIQWKIYGTSSWIDTTGGNTHNGTYYKQLSNTYQETAITPTTFDTSMSWAVTGTVGGVGSSTVCTISSTAATTDSCTAYADYDLGATIPQAASSPPSGTRWQSSPACTFTQTTGGNTNNCNSYKQLDNTYEASTNGMGPPTWDSGLSAAVTGSLYGVRDQTICTISPSSGTTTNAGCTGYADYDQPVSEPATMSGAGSNIQWKLYGTSSWTDTTAANTHTGIYYKQLDNTYQETANSQSTFDTSMSWVVTGTGGGVGSTTVCTISSTTAATDSCSGYADYDLGVTIPQAATSPPSGTRWQSSAACTFTQTTGGNTNNCNSYKQLDNTYAANPTAPTTFSASIAFSVTGSLYGITGQAICTVTVPGSPSSGSYNCAGYADYDAADSIAGTASGSPANQRWQVTGTNSWTDTTGGNTHTANYYLQDSTTVSYSIVGGAGSSSAPTLTYAYLGTAGTTYVMTTTPTVVWQDDGQSWIATNPLTGSGASQRWDAASSTSGASSAGQTIVPTYYNQFDITVSITSIDGSIPGGSDPTFSYTQFGSPATLTVSTSQTTWADNSQAWSITNPISISSTERFDSPSTTSGTISTASTFSITYYHQYKDGFSYSIVGSSTGSSPPTFKFFYEGTVNSTTLSTSPAQLWLDANPAVWNSTNPLAGSNSTVSWITGTPTGSTSRGGGTTSIVYDLTYAVITLFNPDSLTIQFTNSTGSYTSTASPLNVSPGSTFTVVGSNFNGLFEISTNGSTIYQVPASFGNGIQVFSSVRLNLFNFTAGGTNPFLNMTGTSATVIVLDPVPATGLSYVSTTVAGSSYSPTFSQSNTVIQVTTTGTQSILMNFVIAGPVTQTQCVGPSCGGGSTTVTATGEAGGTSTLIQNGQVSVEAGSPSNRTISLVLDNTQSSAITQLTQLSFSIMSNVQVVYNSSELPINVGGGDTGSVPVQVQYSSLAPGSYVINGTATFTQYSSQTNSYVTLHSGFTITLFVQALTGKSDGFNFAAFLTAYWWVFISAAILAVIGVGLFIRKTGR